jgi:Membrane carboxypeptidase/penicillin-binding protein
MYDLLKEPTSSNQGATASAARFGDMPIGGKTGTSSGKKDFWFSGLTPYYSGAVWIGHDKRQPYSSGIGSSTSARILGDIMEVAHKGLKVTDIPQPKGLVRSEICIDSGKKPTDLCAKDPRGSRVRSELFIEGTVPTAMCDVHVEAKINKSNGKLASANTPPDLIESRVFIKRDYKPAKPLLDQKWVLPADIDDTLPQPKPTTPSEPPADVENPDEPENPGETGAEDETQDTPPAEENGGAEEPVDLDLDEVLD